MTGNDYLRALRGSPALLLLLRPDDRFTIVDATDAYLRATFTVREEIVGRPLFEVFPDNPQDAEANGVAMLRASLLRVLATRGADTMALQKYDVRAADRDGFVERWWSPVNAPILAADGSVELIVHRVEDATALARSERDTRANEILDSIDEGFFSLDRKWRFTYLNREGRRILDDPHGRTLGRTLWECYPGLEGTEFECIYRAAMLDGVASSATIFYPGFERWYEAHAYPAPQGISVYFRDVTVTKAAEAERQRLTAEADRQRRIYEAALSNTPDLVYIFGLDHRFVYANEALLAMWGRTRDEAVGRNCLELGYEEWHAAMHDRELREVIASKRAIRGEVPFDGATGRRVWDYIFVPVLGPDGEVVAVAGTSRDTTDRRKVEEAMAQQALGLQEADRAKDEFIATLSHELRNPLAPLRNAVALLSMDTRADERTQKIHGMMARQIDHLVRLVDDLLEISRVTRGDFALRKERVPVMDPVNVALETTRPTMQSRGHSVTVSPSARGLHAEVDPIRLAQIVANLLDNAAKYTPAGGRIEVGVREEAGMALVTVRDNGSGIEPEALDRIFEMFNRGSRASVKAEGGLGIGLALSRRLAAMHGGRLEAASDGAGKGSTFTLSVPLAEAPGPGEAPAPAGAQGAAAAFTSRRILVVDDNRDAADTLGMVLASMGAEVRIAHDGREALDLFPDFDPGAVLLDIGMPDIDGYEVARALRRRFPDRGTLLVALTGWGQEQDRLRAREAGFDRHIVKPADLGALQALISSI